MKHVKKRSEAREQGVRVGDILTQVNGTGVGGENLEVILQFLKDLEQKSSEKGPAQNITLRFRRKATGLHAATARRLAADATKALASVVTKSGGVLLSGGKGVVQGVKHVLANHSHLPVEEGHDVVDAMEDETDKWVRMCVKYRTASNSNSCTSQIPTSFAKF